MSKIVQETYYKKKEKKIAHVLTLQFALGSTNFHVISIQKRMAGSEKEKKKQLFHVICNLFSN